MRISTESSSAHSLPPSTTLQLNNMLPAAKEYPLALSEFAVNSPADSEELEKTFQDFVGQTFFGQMIASMRSTQDEPAYFNGGRAEKIFQGQLDQVLAEELSDSSAKQFSEPMFKLFQLNRR